MVYLCRAPSFVFRRYRNCEACGLRARFVDEDHGWYGTDVTCCNCGAQWSLDSGRRRQTYKQRVAALGRAKGLWKSAGPRSETEAALHEHLGWE
jgi:hypothetical protein